MTVNPLKARLSRKNIAATLKLRTALPLVVAAGLLGVASQAWAQTPSIDVLYYNSGMGGGGSPLTNINGVLWGDDYGTGNIYSYNTTTGATNIYSSSRNDDWAGFTLASNGYLYNTPNGYIQQVSPLSGAATQYYTGLNIQGNMALYNNILYGVATNGELVQFVPSNAAISIVGNIGSGSVTGLIDPQNSLFYGMTNSGGANGDGAIFSYNPSLGTKSTLFSFNNASGYNPFDTSGLAYNNGVLYGTMQSGGTNGEGTLFSYNIASGAYTVLQNFNPTDGEYPQGSVLYSNGVLYGTTQTGGANGAGDVFSYNLSNNSFTVLASFNTQYDEPHAGLTAVGSTLYGLTQNGAIYEVAGYQIGSSTTSTSSPTPSGGGTSVPEPSSLLLFAPALFGLGFVLKRKRDVAH